MKTTYSWLLEHLDTSADVHQICETLTRIGLEVDELDDPRKRFEGFVVGHVLEAKAHPEANKLKVCSVDVGAQKPLQIICGAPNACQGIKVVVALVGATMPLPDNDGNPIVIKVSKMRGIESQGMMCSQRELGLGQDHDGIIELEQDAPVGTAFLDYRSDLADPVIDINVTPNRPDALGVRGIAQDLAAAGLGSLRAQRPRCDTTSNADPDFKINLETQNCPAFAYCIIKGVKNGASPLWMQKKLEAIGLRPISALVDMTNWMTFDNARPMHVFDLAKIKGKSLTVRQAREGESLLALNGKEYSFDEQMTVIADESAVLSLGGIMGGETSGCSDETSDVLIEAALWNPVNIARTGRKLQIHSDARYRFERGVDPATTLEHLAIAVQYVLDACGGEASAIKLVGQLPQAEKELDFDYGLLASHGGVDLERQQGISYLEQLGFTVQQQGSNPDELKVKVPSSRPDIDRQWDLVEEILRLYGYDNIPAVSIPALERFPAKVLNDLQLRRMNTKRALAAKGMNEVITWSFTASEFAPLFGGGHQDLRLANPIIDDLDEMRPSVLPNLIMAAQRNSNRLMSNLALFEEGAVFTSTDETGQHSVISGLRTGMSSEKHWAQTPRKVDAFDAKADCEDALRAAGFDPDGLQIITPAPAWYHPVRSGQFCLGPKKVLAHFGQIHPRVLKAMGFKGQAVGFELFLEQIPQPKNKTNSRQRFAPSAFNPVERDFAFVVDQDCSAATVIKLAKSADRTLIKDVRLFDVYQGQGVPEGKKSLAITVVLQPLSASLDEVALEAVSSKIIAAVSKTTGAELRA